jgi:hypothetical protein
MSIVFAGDQYGGNERVRYIEGELKKIKLDPRFSSSRG